MTSATALKAAHSSSGDDDQRASARVLVLYLTFDEQKKQNVRGVLSAFFDRLSETSFTVVEIDNADETLGWAHAPGDWWDCPAYVVGGDNTAHEFTGWDKGWKEATERLGADFDVVLMVNDALANSKPLAALDAIDSGLIRELSATNTVLGWVDTFSRVHPEAIDTVFSPMRLWGRACRKWLCTTFFMTSAKTFARLTPLTTVDAFDELFSDDPENPFRSDAPLSANYRDFLYTHQTRVWKRGDQRGYALDHESLPLFKNKVRNIINEHALGAKLWRLGVGHVNLAIFDRPRAGWACPPCTLKARHGDG